MAPCPVSTLEIVEDASCNLPRVDLPFRTTLGSQHRQDAKLRWRSVAMSMEATLCVTGICY